jgi:hypothetical protein
LTNPEPNEYEICVLRKDEHDHTHIHLSLEAAHGRGTRLDGPEEVGGTLIVLSVTIHLVVLDAAVLSHVWT